MILTVADLPDVCLSLWIILPDKIDFSFKLHRPFPETLVSKATQKSFLDPLEMFWGIEHLNIEGLFDKDMAYDVENSMKRTIISSPEQVIKTIMALTTEAKEQLHQGNSTQSIFFSAQAYRVCKMLMRRNPLAIIFVEASIRGSTTGVM